MRHPFDCWRQTAAQFRAAGAVALFLDFDGTLAALRRRPEEARLSQRTRRIVGRLALNRRVEVWVISGRRVADVRVRVQLPRVHYLGLHGWEGRPRAPLSAETSRLLEGTKLKLASVLSGLQGIRLEDKGPVFTVHYRGASEPQIGRARASVLAVSDAAGLRVIPCRCSWEILPRSIGDKGTAVERELRLFRRRALPVYLGDDASDEPAFAALPNGVTIRVGRCALTHAKFQLRDPHEVRSFLERLEAELS
jgi:trehalose 6-phosphate phosphatase